MHDEMEMTMELDGDGKTEQTWQVGYWSYRTDLGEQQRSYERIAVTAASLALIEGALVFRDADGDLIKAFGPTGWDEVAH